ncbi:MAG TPA: ATPase, T2SS/T4P/T4SS family [Gammaproteobacteria bacterium]|nr:ATPase, T2SS/T4P/T4SS family [Gammaproteobacteria bacterium]
MWVTELDLDEIPDSQILLSVLPEKVILDYQILVLGIDAEKADVAVADTSNYEILSEISFRLSRRLEIKLVDKYKLSQRIAKLLHKQAQENLTDDAPIVSYVEKLFSDAVNKSASDIHIETEENKLRIRFRIDGILYETAHLSEQLAPRLIAHLKVLAQLDMTERRLPQDGRLRIPLSENKHIDCRINSCPTVHGEKLVLRLLNNSQINLNIDHLGFSESQKNLFLSNLKKPQGMIIVTGPTGSGKTITLYTALNILNNSESNILSAEDPVEIDLPGINQVAVNTKIDLTFAKVLRAFLRQDPDIIMVGEMRDAETADIAIKAAQTGHLVLSTLHTNSAAETFTRLLHMGIPAYHIISSVILIVAQRLVRVLCVYCNGASCNKCQNGFLGRTAIYELLPMSDELREVLLRSPDALTLQKLAKEQGMQSLYEHGLEKVNAGVTSREEVLGVVG